MAALEALEDIVEDLVVLDLAEVITARLWAAECITDPRWAVECIRLPWEAVCGIALLATVDAVAACSL